MTTYTPPNTVMGRALAPRAVALVSDTTPPGENTSFDLRHPAPVDLPSAIRTAAKDALDRGETHYTTRPGIVALRQAIAERSTAAGIPAVANDVVITNGGVEALFIALQTLVSQHETIHIVGIAPKSVHDMIGFLGGKAIEVVGSKEQLFLPAPDQIAEVDASVLIVQSPSPLTGACYSQSEINEILRLAEDADATVVLDHSVASDLASLSSEHQSVGASLITIGSFSAEYGMGGWRIGWFTASAEHIKSMSGFKQTLSICTTSVSQYAALAALLDCQDWYETRKSRLQETRNEITSTLRSCGCDVLESQAGSYLLIDTSILDTDDREVQRRLINERGVDVEAGSDLHDALRGVVRIHTEASSVIEATNIIADYVKKRNG